MRNTIANAILSLAAAREYFESKERRVFRNRMKGRCGSCLKKRWDCRCK